MGAELGHGTGVEEQFHTTSGEGAEAEGRQRGLSHRPPLPTTPGANGHNQHPPPLPQRALSPPRGEISTGFTQTRPASPQHQAAPAAASGKAAAGTRPWLRPGPGWDPALAGTAPSRSRCGNSLGEAKGSPALARLPHDGTNPGYDPTAGPGSAAAATTGTGRAGQGGAAAAGDWLAGRREGGRGLAAALPLFGCSHCRRAAEV